MSIKDQFERGKKFLTNRNLWDAELSNTMSGIGKLAQGNPAQPARSDEELVIAAQQGDAKAFEGLVFRYQRQIFSLIYQMTHNAEVVEDLAQDVFIAAFKAIKDFQARSSFFTWLYRITVNHCKNYLTSSMRVHELQQQDLKEDSSWEFRDNHGSNPHTMLLAKEFVEQMEHVMSALPDDQRVVLTLCEFEGLSYQEIAEVVECPVGTVRSRLSRARGALQEALSDFLA